MSEIANRKSALDIAEGQEEFTPDQVQVLAACGIKGANRGELKVFFEYVRRTQLNPVSKEIYMIPRGGKQTIQIAIDGYWIIAHRAARRDGVKIGMGHTQWCGEDGVWKDVWLSKTPPAAARFTLLRDGEPFGAIATWSEYGTTQPMWKKMPARMLEKCAESLALRRAFPQDLSGTYTTEEMAQADAQEATSAPVRPSQPVGERRFGISPTAPQKSDDGPAPSVPEQWKELSDLLDPESQMTGAEKVKEIEAWLATRGIAREVTHPGNLSHDEAEAMIDDLRHSGEVVEVLDGEQ